MQQVEEELLTSSRVRSLLQALIACSSDEELLLRFLRDLLSFSEIQQCANRWAGAQMLLEGKSQGDVARVLGLSTKTVNGVAKWTTGHATTGGYLEAFMRLHDKVQVGKEPVDLS